SRALRERVESASHLQKSLEELRSQLESMPENDSGQAVDTKVIVEQIRKEVHGLRNLRLGSGNTMGVKNAN
ncbi:MAG: hypothetical protein L3K26_14685, partial [Candidatus Hydrogenedentes bacterium]|nr:hypothetical protein [Candidatus Hydrogenedentota bacterium]